MSVRQRQEIQEVPRRVSRKVEPDAQANGIRPQSFACASGFDASEFYVQISEHNLNSLVRERMPFVVAWFLNAAYALLLLVVSPFLVYRGIAHGKYRGGWREKLTGRLARKHPERRCLWFHAVSVGEVLQLQQILDQTAARFPDAELFITTTTDTGYEVARSKYPQHTVAYFPLDFSWAVRRALRTIQPSVVVLVELELWPNFIVEAHRQRIPLALINGRIGEKSFRGYSRV